MISVSSNSIRLCNASIFLNDIFQLATAAGNRDTATGNPIHVAGTDLLRIVFAGGVSGAQTTVTINYDEQLGHW